MEGPASSRTIHDLFEQSAREFASRRLFGHKKGGVWRWRTYAEVAADVSKARRGLARLGVGEGDRVAVISANSVEWAVVAYATYGRSAAYVPMYPHQPERDWEYILRDCEAKVLLVGTVEVLRRVERVLPGIPSLQHVVVVEEGAALPAGGQVHSYAELMASGAEGDVTDAVLAPTPGDIAGFIYTSGTTGTPKGALLSHRNIVSVVQGVEPRFAREPEERSLSFLPWAHVFGQVCDLHIMMSRGSTIALAESPEKVIDNLGEVQPTMLFAVPRVFNQLHKVVQTHLNGPSQAAERVAEEARRVAATVSGGASLSPRGAVYLAMDRLQTFFAARPSRGPSVMQRLLVTAEHAAAKTRAGQPLSFVERAAWTVADRFVFSKVRARFGGKLRFAFSGGAAMAIEVAEFVDSLGVMVYQGYGLTETAAISTVNYPGHRKMGSAGLPLPGMRVEIEPHEEAEEHDGHSVGEIVIHGPSVMVGYHKLPAETAAAFTPGGGLRTGDLGYLDRDGYLFITGRLKEQYKLDNGKFVAPAALEEKLKLSPYVANVMVYGVNRPCNVALVVPDEPAVKGWAVKEGVHLDEARLHRDPKVCALVAGEIARLSAGFGGYEVVRAFEVLEHDLTVESGLLTPSLKVKRAKVVEAYRDRIDAMYERMPSFCPPPGRKEPS